MLSLISSSSSMMRTDPLRLDIYSLPEQWQLKLESGPAAKPAIHRNVSTVLLHDSVADREAETCSLADGLGRKERIVDFFDVLAADTGAGVLNRHLNLGIRGFRTNL